jgi:anti-anti-sigma factor
VDTCSRTAYVDGDDFVVELAGDIDYQVGRLLFAELNHYVEAAGRRRVVVDVRAVPFIDSSGLRALLHANAICECFVVRGAQPQLLRVTSLIAPGVLAVEP